MDRRDAELLVAMTQAAKITGTHYRGPEAVEIAFHAAKCTRRKALAIFKAIIASRGPVQ